MALKQNNLAESTTELGFPAETNTPLQREETLEDGTKVIVEGITPHKMKNILNGVTFKTPGEPYKNGNIELNGVVQTYNEGSSGQKFDTITLGGRYKFKFKEKLDLIDSMSIEEITEFFSIPDNSVVIKSADYNFIETSSFPVGYAMFLNKDKEEVEIAYAPQCMTETEGSPFYGLTPGWYNVDLIPVTSSLLDEFTIGNISLLANNYNGETGSRDEIFSYDSSKLDWLFDSVEDLSDIKIKIITPPNKTNYNIFENFDPTGMVVKASYSDGTSKIITDYTIQNFNFGLLIDTNNVAISYEGATTVQPITVTNKVFIELPDPLVKVDGKYTGLNESENIKIGNQIHQALEYYWDDLTDTIILKQGQKVYDTTFNNIIGAQICIPNYDNMQIGIELTGGESSPTGFYADPTGDLNISE